MNFTFASTLKPPTNFTFPDPLLKIYEKQLAVALFPLFNRNQIQRIKVKLV